MRNVAVEHKDVVGTLPAFLLVAAGWARITPQDATNPHKSPTSWPGRRCFRVLTPGEKAPLVYQTCGRGPGRGYPRPFFPPFAEHSNGHHLLAAAPGPTMAKNGPKLGLEHKF